MRVKLPPPAQREDAVLRLNVYEIDDNPFQPRRDFGDAEIASLAESLKEHDMLQPVLVRRVGDRYQLISGERRLRAAIRAGWSTIPARLRVADDRLVAELAIVENLQRKDLNPIEKALSFKRYLDQHQCAQEELANRLKIDRSTIANLMRLLELPDSVIDAVRAERLTAGHARALLPLGDERLQASFAQQILQEAWSVRETERRVQDRIASEDHEPLRVVGGPDPGRQSANSQRPSGVLGTGTARGTRHTRGHSAERPRTWQADRSFHEPRGIRPAAEHVHRDAIGVAERGRVRREERRELERGERESREQRRRRRNPFFCGSSLLSAFLLSALACRHCHSPTPSVAWRTYPPVAKTRVTSTITGRSAAWLARLLWEQEVESSNLSAPIFCREAAKK